MVCNKSPNNFGCVAKFIERFRPVVCRGVTIVEIDACFKGEVGGQTLSLFLPEVVGVNLLKIALVPF